MAVPEVLPAEEVLAADIDIKSWSHSHQYVMNQVQKAVDDGLLGISLLIYQSCPGSFSFSLGGNAWSKTSQACSSTKYPLGVAYSPVMPSK